MSRLFPDALRIAFAPDQVVLDHQAIELTLGGARARLLQRQVLATGRETQRAAWDGALRVLAKALEAVGDRRCSVTMILANSLVRYALVPQTGHLNPDEEASVLRHCFREIYGETADGWELRVSATSGMPFQPASGVDRALLDGLRGLFPGDRLRLRSIQPRLMAVCNEHRAALNIDVAWLLLVEPGNICLGLVSGGGLARLRSLRIGTDWATELPWLLEREACLAELDQAPSDLLLWHRDGVVPTLPGVESLRLHQLQDLQPAEPVAGDEALAVARG